MDTTGTFNEHGNAMLTRIEEVVEGTWQTTGEKADVDAARRDLAIARTHLEDALTRFNSAWYRINGTWQRADAEKVHELATV